MVDELDELHTKNVKRAWWKMKAGSLGINAYDYRRAWTLRSEPHLIFPEALELFQWVAERIEADYWSVVMANKTNNRIVVGWDYPDDRHFERAHGDDTIGLTELLSAIDDLVKAYPGELYGR